MTSVNSKLVEQKQRLEKIANMQLHDIGNRQIARACNLTEARIGQIMQTEEYQAVLSELSSEFLEKQKTLNDGWDALEEQSLSGLVDMMKYNKSPEFLLKVAAVSNRATRRGVNPTHKPLDAANAGRVVIQLNQTFVNRLQEAVPATAQPTVAPIITTEDKQTDIMAPVQVEKLLDVRPPVRDEDDLVPGFDDVQIEG